MTLDFPEGFDVDFQFDRAPWWLRSLALAPYLEKYAYQIALSRGLGVLWQTENSCTDSIPGDDRWIVMNQKMDYESLLY